MLDGYRRILAPLRSVCRVLSFVLDVSAVGQVIPSPALPSSLGNERIEGVSPSSHKES